MHAFDNFSKTLPIFKYKFYIFLQYIIEIIAKLYNVVLLIIAVYKQKIYCLKERIIKNMLRKFNIKKLIIYAIYMEISFYIFLKFNIFR